MNTSPKSKALFSILAACLPLTSAFGQAPASAPKPQTPVIITRDTRNFNANSTPATQAAEAARSKRWQADIARGEALMKAGDLDGAVEAFQQVLSYDPNNGLAYRRMAEAYAAEEKLPEASRAFHKFLIEGFGPGTNGGVGDSADEWAEYALVLVKTGQPAEAIRCYNHAASLLDYEDSDTNGGKPYLKVLLPELVAAHPLAAQVQYTPERLQALADTALAHEETAFGSNKEAVGHMQEAVKLYPDTPVTHYYLGEVLLRSRDAGAKAAYAKAAQLGDEQTRAAANERISHLR